MMPLWLKNVAQRAARIPFVRSAIEDEADLSAFKQPPTLRILAGVGAIILSYVIGWPLISLLAAASVYAREPLIVGIGGPLAYGLSHLVFLLGMALAGAEYTHIFLRWSARKAVMAFLDTPIPRNSESIGSEPDAPGRHPPGEGSGGSRHDSAP
jgi:hypothetical protein